MSPEDEPNANSEAPQTVQTAEASREGRRSNRRFRGRGRRRGKRKPSPALPGEAGAQEEPSVGPEPVPSAVGERGPDEAAVLHEAPPPEHAQEEQSDTEEAVAEQASAAAPEPPAGPATLADAIEQVNEIIVNLRGALDEMEEVLEHLEAFERQTGNDQREIESLRRALRQLHRPREGGEKHRGR